MKVNKLNILILLMFVFVMMLLIFLQVDYVLEARFKTYFLPVIIFAIISYIIIYGLDLYRRLKLYNALNKLLIIAIALVNLIIFIVLVTLVPILTYYNISSNLIIAMNSALISMYVVISGFSVIILNKYFPRT